jgi:hypothetical protein
MEGITKNPRNKFQNKIVNVRSTSPAVNILLLLLVIWS